jgi:hypothetical protein
LVAPNQGLQWIDKSSLVVVTEGTRVVAYFHVHDAT